VVSITKGNCLERWLPIYRLAHALNNYFCLIAASARRCSHLLYTLVISTEHTEDLEDSFRFVRYTHEVIGRGAPNRSQPAAINIAAHLTALVGVYGFVEHLEERSKRPAEVTAFNR
jgi:hypothetical protein